MSEMIATINAKSIGDIKSFLSRQKETYKIPYETHNSIIDYTNIIIMSYVQKTRAYQI